MKQKTCFITVILIGLIGYTKPSNLNISNIAALNAAIKNVGAGDTITGNPFCHIKFLL